MADEGNFEVADKNMSGDNEVDTCCASCGIAEIDDIKLVPCDDCDLVKYCGDVCKEDHKSEHTEACKKRAVELRDELLFKQPEGSCYGDCPVCRLPMPLDQTKSTIYPCCSKTICSGCVIVNKIRDAQTISIFSGDNMAPSRPDVEDTCPFCREPVPSSTEESVNQMMKRVEMNDPVAVYQRGAAKYTEENYGSAFKYFTKAAELGNVGAHFRLAAIYHHGHGVEKDEAKETYHFEKAAIGGHPRARYLLGREECKKGNLDRAVKHLIIAATQGHDESIKALMRGCKKGYVEKEGLAAALRAHKAAVDATKSPEREMAEEYYQSSCQPSCCASCGIAENDDIKLVPCDKCDLVRYCSDECQRHHRSDHEEDCKKRAAELRDKLLFKQPESSHMGDCPICCLPLPLDLNKSIMMACCSKVICKGCEHANRERERKQGIIISCPFCREPAPKTEEERDKQRMKRIDANDPAAIYYEGTHQHKKGDHTRAFEYFSKAAKLGDVHAHYKLAVMYHEGQGVEKDREKQIFHLEEATFGGHPDARYRLGLYEGEKRNFERALTHFIIAAVQGEDLSIKMLMNAYKDGSVSKDFLDAILRAHQAAVTATKSPHREAVKEFY